MQELTLIELINCIHWTRTSLFKYTISKKQIFQRHVYIRNGTKGSYSFVNIVFLQGDKLLPFFFDWNLSVQRLRCFVLLYFFKLFIGLYV